MPFSDTTRAPRAAPVLRRLAAGWAPALLLLFLAGAVLCPLARAQEEEDLTAGLSEMEVHLNKGKELFHDLKFPEAIHEFDQVIQLYEGGKVQDMGADVIKKVAEALDLRARAYFNQGNQDRAREDFAKLLRVKIDYKLDESLVSPKVIDLFNEVKKNNVGSLSVSTDPPGAQVFLGDEPLGRTPIVGQALMQGTYKLKVLHKGYDEVQEDLTITPRAELKKEVHLVPNARNLQFITQPAGVNVFLDDQMVGTTFGSLPPDYQSVAKDAGLDPTKASAPLLVPSVAPGSHVVRFEKECYQPTPRTISVKLDLEHNAPQIFTPVLMKEDLGQIRIVSHPSGAQVLVDGKPQGTTPLQQAAICAGDREIRLVKEGEGTWFERVRIQPGVLNTLDARLRPTLLYLGTFRLDTWGRLNWSDEDKLLQDGMRSLGSVNQVRSGDALKTFRDALVTEMTRPSEVDQLKQGKGIPSQKVADALGQFQADLLMAVISIEEGGTQTSTLFLYSSEQPEPDRVTIDLGREADVKSFLSRFDHVPDLQRPWIGATFADTLLGEGPVVVRVVKGGPAGEAGLLPGDQVLSIDNRQVADARSLDVSNHWKAGARLTFAVKRDAATQSVALTVGSTPVLLPMDSPDILYNKALCDYRQISRGGDDPLTRSLALLDLGISLMHFHAYDKALSEALNLANLPPGGGISRGTVRYYQGLCLLKKELVPEARTAFQEAAAAADATLESNDGPPVSARARSLLK